MGTLDFTGMSLDQKYEAAAKFAGVEASVMKGIHGTESSFGKNMRSPAGARGHMGIMPQIQQTWEERNGKTYDPDNIDDALEMAAYTLKENLGKFKNVPDALRAYNGGWDRERWGNSETSAYVGKVAKFGGNGGLKTAMLMQQETMDAKDPRAPDMSAFERAWRGEYDQIDLRDLAAKAKKQYLTDIEKGLGHQAGVETLINNSNAQEALNTAVAVKQEFNKNAYDNAMAVAANSDPVLAPTDTSKGAMAVATAKQNAAIEREQFAQSLTWNDKWGANFGNSLMAGAMRAFDNEVADFYPNGWSYADNAKEIEKGYTLREREWLREAVSPADVERIKGHIEQQRYDQRIQGALSGSSQLGWSLLAGVTDPVGWAAGLGIGKAAQLAKVGAATYAAAGRPLAALASGAIEGAVGNVITGVALEAMGDRRTLGDYVSDAGYGLVFGGALSGLPSMRDARITNLRREMDAEAAVQNAELAIRAQAEAGPNATADQVGRVMDRLMQEEDASWRQAKLGNVSDQDRLFQRTEVGAAPEVDQDGNIVPPRSISIFRDAADKEALIAKYDLKNAIPDNDMLEVVAEVIGRSERIDGRIQIQPEKLKTFLAHADLEATSTKMLKSQSPVARAIGAMLMENPEGAAGRRSTAAISRAAHFEEYMGNISRATDNAYEQWAREQGIGTIGIMFRDEPRIQFNRQVQLEMDRRWNGRPEGPVHPMVKRAADLYDTGYNMMARDQKHVGVLGADALDVNSRGYFQRSWNGAALRGMTGSRRIAFLNALEDQFRTVAGFRDGEGFSVRALAVQYLSRLEHRATGMIDVPANMYSADAGSVIKDALHSMGLTKEEVEKQMRAFDRGRAGHTKERIDMDYSRTYEDGAGNKFMLVDYLDNDMNGLYRRYAQRTAGDVALAKYGVMGDQGAKVLREAMTRTGATQKELNAFDQFIAEMTGRQFGNGDPLIVQNARMLTNLTRMGGAVFPQMGAYVDAVAGLGASRALKVAGMTNQMRKEVQALARGEKVNNPILGGFEGLGPEFGLADYRVFGIFDTTDMVDIAGKETIGRGTKAIRAGAHLQRVMSGHRWVTAAQTRGVADQIVRKAMRYLKEGGEDVALKDMGIDGEMAATLKERMSKIAVFKDGELASFDPRKLDPDDIVGRKAVIEFRDAVMRGTNQIMNKEFAGEVGKWAHNGWLKMLFQFRTFSMVAQQKSFNRILHTQGAAKLTGLLIGGMAVGVPMHMARVALRASMLPDDQKEEFLDKQLHPMALGRAAMNYLAAMGLWADVVESASGLASGWADVAGFEMPDGLSPTGGRMMRDTSLIGGQFAPSLGVINDIGQGVMGKPDKLWKTAPFASLPYIQPILMGIDAAMED
ncbi:transglycosylase [Stenotrophomonas phage BUCT609]|uniref:Transglycosylase n=1 Tax=Stenotrophomonas phage BUCT609 TaxID=2834250 RepID=A0A8E6PLI4_9CAUD|nr:transglycosylase [Stenotrophomonas phage BUCT609]